MKLEKVQSNVVLRNLEKIIDKLYHREANFKVRLRRKRIFNSKIELIGFEKTSAIIFFSDHFLFAHPFRLYFVCINCERNLSNQVGQVLDRNQSLLCVFLISDHCY